MVFKILAAALIGVAAFFFLQNRMDGVFVSVVLGVVSFLLSIRFSIKARLRQHEAGKAEDILRK